MLLLDGGGSGMGVASKVKSAHSADVQSTAKIAAGSTYTVTITHDSIITYEETGVTITDGQTMDFVVTSISNPTVREGITFVSIPSGTFQMGDEVGDLDDMIWVEVNCGPVHTVSISSFEMSIYEITNAQYAQYLTEALASGDITATSSSITGKTGDWSGEQYINLSGSDFLQPDNDCKIAYSNGTFNVKSGYNNWPVTWVSWFGAKAFAEYYGLDLPTEAEWEFACRGGNQYLYGTADGNISTSTVNYWDSELDHPVDVGSHPANPFGLFDLSGNVSEWCRDWYDEYSSTSVTNPVGPTSGIFRIVRGGGFPDQAELCRSALHYGDPPADMINCVGFRVVHRSSEWTPGNGGSEENGSDLSFAQIPAGTFRMGDIQGKGNSNERPVHNVTLSGFEMSAYEVTNAQYAAYLTEALESNDITVSDTSVQGSSGNYSGEEYLNLDFSDCEIGYNGGVFTVESGRETYPVIDVTWYGAKAFALYYGLDLPTEAEWEYACRAGTETLFYTGNNMDSDGERSSDLDRAGWYYYNSDTGGGRWTHAVGEKEKNAWGLFDMHGNVCEWCHDLYEEYSSESVTNPTGAQTGFLRLIRGGHWNYNPFYCRSAYRGYGEPYDSNYYIGFRVVRRPDGVIY